MPNPHYYASHIVTRIGAPDSSPVSLLTAKSNLRVDHDEDDALIQLYIDAATSYLDGNSGIMGRAIVDQIWRVTVPFESAPSGNFKFFLPVVSARELLVVKYYDAANVLVTADLANFMLVADGSWAYIAPASGSSWPVFYDRHDALIIEWKAGYGDADSVPAAIRSAILLMVGDLYRYRETVAIGVTAAQIPMSTTVNALLAPFRLVGI